MNVVVLQVFVSLMLVASSVVLFLVCVRQRDHEHADRLDRAVPGNRDAIQAQSFLSGGNHETGQVDVQGNRR